jgi:hypothetical protein
MQLADRIRKPQHRRSVNFGHGDNVLIRHANVLIHLQGAHHVIEGCVALAGVSARRQEDPLFV